MNKSYGYTRVSTKKELENDDSLIQLGDILYKYPNAIVYEEQFSDKPSEKPQLEKLLATLDEKDILVITKLTKLTTDLKECIEILQALFNRNIDIDILNIAKLDTNILKKLFLNTLISIADMKKKHTIENARKSKILLNEIDGRPNKFTDEKINAALSMLIVNGGKYSYKQVSKMTNISKSTLIRKNKGYIK